MVRGRLLSCQIHTDPFSWPIVVWTIVILEELSSSSSSTGNNSLYKSVEDLHAQVTMDISLV